MKNAKARKRAADFLAENGLSDADANAALEIDDWQQTPLDPDEFKAAIEAYVEQMVSLPPARPKNET
ncbi:MAG: hypothetical protein JW966_12045 [Anaerolineae bacterium]|nr:hypothetical protein [Anaerolineae bacterium]